MRLALAAVAAGSVMFAAVVILSLQTPALGNGGFDVNAAYSTCESACAVLFASYRSDPSSDLAASAFCATTFNNYDSGGIFADHCYREDGDIVRYECVISSLDGTTIEMNREGCLV